MSARRSDTGEKEGRLTSGWYMAGRPSVHEHWIDVIEMWGVTVTSFAHLRTSLVEADYVYAGPSTFVEFRGAHRCIGLALMPPFTGSTLIIEEDTEHSYLQHDH